MTQVQSVKAARGVFWVVDGLRNVARQPLMWVGVTVLLLTIDTVLLVVPAVGRLLWLFFVPVLAAGLLYAAREAERGREIEFGHVFQGFQDSHISKRLLLLGGMIVLLSLLAGFILVFVAIVESGGVDPTTLAVAMSGRVVSVISVVVMVVAVLIVAVAAYAVPLIMFAGSTIISALRLSFLTCIRNIVPLLVFGLAYVLLVLAVSIPVVFAVSMAMGKGVISVLTATAILLLILVPITSSAWYASYRDCFSA
jgi:hypothetical protein